MAWLFIRLKLRLLANGFRLGWQQAMGLILVAVMVLPVAGLIGVAVAVAGVAGNGETDALVAAVTLGLGAAWLIFPVLAFGVDETLDPARLQLVPLRRRQLVTGLLAASLIGGGAIATILILTGVVVGFAPPGAGALVAVIAMVLQLLLCVLTARVVTAALSLRLRTRRGRDTVALLAALAGVGFAFIGQLPGRLVESGDALAAAGPVVMTAAGYVPFGWPARAVVAAREDTLAVAVLWLIPTAAFVVLLGFAWLRALEHAMTTVAPPVVRNGSDEDLFPAAVRWLPRNRVGASIAKELRYFSRLPQLRVGLLLQPLFAIGAIVAVAVIDPLQQPQVVLAPPVLGMLFGLVALNAFGGDGRALWLVVATGRLGWQDLAAKNAALALIVLPIVSVSAVALAALTGGWIYVMPSVLLAITVLGVTTGVGNVASVLAPQPLPESPVNAFAAAQGMGCATAVIQLLSMAAVGVILAPVVAGVAISVLALPSALSVVAVASTAWAGGAWFIGARIAGAQLRSRGPDIVAALTPRG